MGAPVGHTCPDIDKAIKKVKHAYDVIYKAKKRATEEDFKDYIDEVEDCLYGLDDILEDLRKDNNALREWGHEKESEIAILEQEIETLQLANEQQA